MNIKNLTFKNYNDIEKNIWDNIVLDFDGNINYSYWMINYILVYNEKNNIKNLSYLIYRDNIPLSIVPLFVENINKKNQISAGENMINSPLFHPELEQKEIIKLYETIINYVDKIANEYDCILSRFQIPPLNMQKINYYKLFGYTEEIKSPDWYIFKCPFSYIMTLIDKNISDIRIDIRKSFKSLINKTSKSCNLIILDKDNTDKNIFDKYVNTHYELKGNTRTKEAFKEDYKAVCDGLETILICEYEGKYIGVVILYTFNDKSIYNSAMQRYDVANLYPNHFLMWASIEYLYEKNYKYFLNGEKVVDNGIFKITEKEKNLSYFKQAWGGELYPWIKAQKVYDVSPL